MMQMKGDDHPSGQKGIFAIPVHDIACARKDEYAVERTVSTN